MVANVYSCTLKEGKTSEDAHAINGQWLKWARAKAGTDDIRSSYTTSIVGDLEGFMWVDTYPDLAAWAKINGADMEEENPELIERGIFVQDERPEYCSEYDKIIEKLKGGQP